MRSHKEGATTRWFAKFVACKTSLASRTQTDFAVGGDIVCGAAKAAQT